MQTQSPSAENEAEGMQGAGETAQAEIQSPEPLISGAAPALWAGAGTTLLVFLIGMVLLIRGRVTRPAQRRAENANKTYFEPAGEDADITFDDSDPPQQTPEPIAETETTQWRDDEVSDTELVIEHGDHEENNAAPESENEAPPAKTEKKKSPFANLFTKKSVQEQEEPAIDEASPTEDYAADDGFFPAAPDPQPADEAYLEEPVPSQQHQETAPTVAPAADEERLLQAEDAAQQALKRADEAEALARDLERANKEAQDVMNLGLRKQEAALDERANALLAMEKRLSGLSQEFEQRAESLKAMPVAAPAQTTSTSDDVQGVSEAHFAEFANLMGEQFDALRGTVNTALDRMSRRIDNIPPAQTGAPTATAARVQLSDLLGDVLAPGRFKLNHKLSTNRTADAIIIMPGPMAPLAVDARFPVEAFDAWQLSRNAGTETELRRAILRHIADGAEKLITPDETADCAMMFVPSENILSELHAHFSDLVQESHRARVWMVSPTSLMATLHTISAVMAGAGIREMSAVNVIDELHALRERVAALETQQPSNDVEDSHREAEAHLEETAATQLAAPYVAAQYGDLFERPASPKQSASEEKPPFPLR